MQEYEDLYNTIEQDQEAPRVKNDDPREQSNAEAREPKFRSYEEGYTGTREREFWAREGEKLQPGPGRGPGLSLNALLALLVVVCAAFILGGVFSFIWSWLVWLVVVTLILFGMVVAVSNWRVVDIPMPVRTFQVMEHAHLSIDNSSGAVTVRRGDGQAISVQAIKQVRGFGLNAEGMQIDYSQRGDSLDIVTRSPWSLFLFGWHSFKLEVTVPASCDLQLHTGSGKVMLEGTSGDIQVRTGSGRIEASALQGQIALRTGSGGIQLDHLEGRVLLHTGSGGIRASDIQGSVSLKTGSGGIVFERSRLTGDSRMTTGSGGIEVEGELDPLSRTELITGSGGIVVHLPFSTALEVDARTGSGGVHNDFANQENGFGPRARLKLRSGSGGIRIRRSWM